MSLSISIALFFAIIVLFSLVISIFTLLFRLLGLTEEKAKFQVISAITNCGFTTKESELVMDSVKRRQLVKIIMLFGYIFSIIIITAFVNVVLNLPKAEREDFWIVIIVIAALIVLYMVVTRIPLLKDKFNAFIERSIKKILSRKDENVITLIDQYGKGVLVGIMLINVPKSLEGKPISEINKYSETGFKIINIERSGKIIEDLEGKLQLEQQDFLTMFGSLKKIKELFDDSSKGKNK